MFAETQELGRKLKVASSGCRENACGLVTMHDMGAIAKRKGSREATLVFGRGGEEAQALCRTGIQFEAVPGVSSALVRWQH